MDACRPQACESKKTKVPPRHWVAPYKRRRVVSL